MFIPSVMASRSRCGHLPTAKKHSVGLEWKMQIFEAINSMTRRISTAKGGLQHCHFHSHLARSTRGTTGASKPA